MAGPEPGEHRFWIDDNIPYHITLDGIDATYVGLVDEYKGGIVAFGAYDNILELATRLNLIKYPPPPD